MALVQRSWTAKRLLKKRDKLSALMHTEFKKELAQKVKFNYVAIVQTLATVSDSDPDDQKYNLQIERISESEYPIDDYCTPISLLELDELWEA